MVRRSTLVYHLLRTERPAHGFTQKEILRLISDRYDITAGKTLRRQIAVALRHGLDFGILDKRTNKYRFVPDFAANPVLIRRTSKKNQTQKTKKTKRRKTTGRPKRGKNTTTTIQRKQAAGKTRNAPKLVPRPRLRTPPNWSPIRRNLRKEPLPRFVKYS